MESIVTLIVGAVICFFGVRNMMGDISSLHSYHRHRVTEENRKPFGKLVGLGTLIIGIALIVYGTLLFIYEQTQLDALVIIGTVGLIAGIVAGMAVSFYAMKKYNGGIF